MKRLAVIALVLFAAAAAGADVLTIDRFLGMTRCADPQISPDGLAVAFTVSVPDLDANRNRTHIWVASLPGGEPRQLTAGDGADVHPRWSPDNSHLAFVSTRGGSPQVWTIPVHGGEATRVTDISTGAHDPVWSPCGRYILFYSFVDPGCPDDSCNAARAREREESPVKARVIDRLLYRHWDTWKEGRRNHLFLVEAAGGEARDLTPGENHDIPGFPWGGSGEYAFSPDGREIAVAAKMVEDEAISTNYDIFLIDPAGGGMRRATTNGGADESPAFSPDGRWLAWRSQETPGFEADRWRLMLRDRRTGETRELTAGFDRWVNEFVWAPDSRRIVFTAGDDGCNALFSIDTRSGKIRTLVSTGTNGSPGVSPDGRRIVLVRRSWSFPHSIWTCRADGTDLERVTSFNEPVFSSIEMNDAESVGYEGAGGDRIQAFLIKPPGFDPGKTYPAIVLVHGGPQSAFADSWYTNWNAQTFAAAGYVIFIPNFRGSDGFGQEFVNAISLDWGGAAYEDIMRGVDWLAALPYVDAGRIGAAGASFGGYMVNWIAGHTDRFAAFVSMAGAFNLASKTGVTEELWFPEWDFGGSLYERPELYEKWSPHRFAANFSTPTLVVHGELDFRVPVGEGLQMFTALQRLGVPSRLLYFPDEGHWVLKPRNNELYYREFIGWMDRWLKAPADGS
ncbi:MAG: S9 family peptidase [Candidatus Krumholzibacteriota bacterium]|nr:S9 family peptidase [Candidatus Krumholzibacteriota bacterium]